MRGRARLLAGARDADDARSIAALAEMGAAAVDEPSASRYRPSPRTSVRGQGDRRRAEGPAGAGTRRRHAGAPIQDERGEEYSYLQFVGRKGDGMFSGVNLPALGTRFDIPVFIVQGAEDLATVPDVTHDYFERLAAPEKALVVEARTGHDPNAHMLEDVHTLLVKRVRPLIE